MVKKLKILDYQKEHNLESNIIPYVVFKNLTEIMNKVNELIDFVNIKIAHLGDINVRMNSLTDFVHNEIANIKSKQQGKSHWDLGK